MLYTKFHSPIPLLAVIGLVALCSNRADESPMQTGGYDPTFDAGSGADGVINDMAETPDGKIYIAGDFDEFNGFAPDGGLNLVRLHPDGAVDESFFIKPIQTDFVVLVAPQGDGVIALVYAEDETRLLRFKADGTLDEEFAALDFESGKVPRTGQHFANFTDLLLLPDGRIAISGVFKLDQGGKESNWRQLILLDSNGALVENFNPAISANNTIGAEKVLTIVPQNDGILIGGYFVSIDGVEITGSARFDSEDELDPSWNSDVPAFYPTVIDQQGRVIGSANLDLQTDVESIVRTDEFGKRDPTYQTPPSGGGVVTSEYSMEFWQMVLLDNGALWVVGINGFNFYLDRLLPDGRRDPSFELNLPPNLEFPLGGSIPDMIKLSDGGILLPGRDKDTSRAVPIKYRDKAVEELPTIIQISDDQDLIEGQTLELEVFAEAASSLQYQWYFNGEPLEGANAAKLVIDNVRQEHEGAYLVDVESESGALTTSGAIEARVFNAPAGRIDPAFENERQVDGLIHAVAALPDDRLLVGGEFNQWNGREVKPLIRLNPGGSLDESFQIDSNFEGKIGSVFPLRDGGIWVGGSFEAIGDFDTQNLARLLPNGTVDDSFSTEEFSFFIQHIVPHTDGGLLLGGITEDGSGRAALMASDGATVWSSGYAAQLSSMFWSDHVPVQGLISLPDGDALVGGPFNVEWLSVGGSIFRVGLVRINSDGGLDESWPIAIRDAYSLVHQHTYDVSLFQQDDGNILIAGAFNYENSLNKIVKPPLRVNPDGEVDESLIKDNLPGHNTILHVDDKDRLYFTGADGYGSRTPKNLIIRLHGDGALDSTFEQYSTGLHEVLGIVRQSDGGLLVWGLEEGESEAPRSALLRLLPEAIDELRIAGFSRETNPETQQVHLTLDIQTQANATYALQYKNDLAGADWTTLEQFQGDGALQIISAEQEGPRRYFRIMEESP